MIHNLKTFSQKSPWKGSGYFFLCFLRFCWELARLNRPRSLSNILSLCPSSCSLWTAWSGTTSSATLMARTSTPSTPTLPSSLRTENRRSSCAKGSTSSCHSSPGQMWDGVLAAFLFQLLLLLHDQVVLLHSCLQSS